MKVTKQSTRHGQRIIFEHVSGNVHVEGNGVMLSIQKESNGRWGIYHYVLNARRGYTRYLPYYSFSTKRAAMASARRSTK